MAIKYTMSLASILVLMPLITVAQEHAHGNHHAPYAGLETREVKSLSKQDIEELRRGGGWGLALPAELNGLPGPAHLLELQEELSLTADQVEKISVIYEKMREAAISAGDQFIAAEAALSNAFEGSELSKERLRDLLADAATARAELRYIHLSAHLATPKILSEVQQQKYNVLRGYAKDPCASVPKGHDPKMWRRHNGC